MIYPGTELRLIDERTGYGVFATSLIPRGSVVWVHDELDQVLSAAHVATLPAVLQKHVERYAYLDGKGNRVLCWDHGRYMNHSCEPNTTSIGTLMEVAREDIQSDEELTCEYGMIHVVEAFDCACGAPGCRGRLEPNTPATWERWDREAAEVFGWAIQVDQPVLTAAASQGPGAWIIQAILERRHVQLPSWADGVPGS